MAEKTNRIITVEYPGISELTGVVKRLDGFFRKGKLDCLAINPHEKFRLYIRAALIDMPERIELEKSGHYGMLLRYLGFRNLHGEYLDTKDFKRHIAKIQQLMQEKGYRNLVSVVKAENRDFFTEKFSKQGFTIL